MSICNGVIELDGVKMGWNDEQVMGTQTLVRNNVPLQVQNLGDTFTIKPKHGDIILLNRLDFEAVKQSYLDRKKHKNIPIIRNGGRGHKWGM